MAIDLKASVDPQQVRAAINATLNAAALPDATVLSPIYVNPAVRLLKSYHPEAEDATAADDIERIESALHFLVAANLVQALPQITSQSLGGESWSENVRDIPERVAELQGKALEELDALVSDSASDPPTIFDVASGRRGL